MSEGFSDLDPEPQERRHGPQEDNPAPGQGRRRRLRCKRLQAQRDRPAQGRVDYHPYIVRRMQKPPAGDGRRL